MLVFGLELYMAATKMLKHLGQTQWAGYQPSMAADNRLTCGKSGVTSEITQVK